MLETVIPSLVYGISELRDLGHDVMTSYLAIAPDVFTCVFLFLGCHIGYMQLASIDLGGTPALCIATCASAIVSFCGQMLVNTVALVGRNLVHKGF